MILLCDCGCPARPRLPAPAPVTVGCPPGRRATGQACAARQTGPHAHAVARSRMRAAGRWPLRAGAPRAPDSAAARQPIGSSAARAAEHGQRRADRRHAGQGQQRQPPVEPGLAGARVEAGAAQRGLPGHAVARDEHAAQLPQQFAHAPLVTRAAQQRAHHAAIGQPEDQRRVVVLAALRVASVPEVERAGDPCHGVALGDREGPVR